MALEIWDWDTFKRKAQEDELLNGEKYRYQFDIAKAWLKSGGRVTMHRWAMRRDFETHLIQKGKNIILVECDGERQVWCTLDQLRNDDFMLIPNNHVIGEFNEYPAFMYQADKYEQPIRRNKVVVKH
jgi:hypothetical protein